MFDGIIKAISTHVEAAIAMLIPALAMLAYSWVQAKKRQFDAVYKAAKEVHEETAGHDEIHGQDKRDMLMSKLAHAGDAVAEKLAKNPDAVNKLLAKSLPMIKAESVRPKA